MHIGRELLSSVKTYFLILFVTLVTACGGGGGDAPPDGGPTPPDQPTSSVNLQVVSSNGVSLADVAIQIGTTNYGVTDENGQLSLTG